MDKQKLALNGGEKYITEPLKRYNSISSEEVMAAKDVVESGNLSQFLGAWSKDFYGGPKVREFEMLCQETFEVEHAISVNSWTSGLIAAVAAVEIEPGDEVIVSPFTMSASASAIIHNIAIPVFADIEQDTFCIDPISVEKNISEHTRAIMAIDIFGQSADMDALKEIAQKYDLKLISDTAQAPGAKYKDKFAGTLADVGGYSLNYHKHIHTGEGGILVTDDEVVAEKLRLIRNHAEAVVEAKGESNLTNMVGYNFRLGEIESAIGIEQVKKLSNLVESRQQAAEKLISSLGELDGISLPVIRNNCSHSFYIFPLKIDTEFLGIARSTIAAALSAEGLEGLLEGYTNIHRLPMYQNKISYGSNGFPWTSDICKRDVIYEKGICPVAEDLYDRTFLGLSFCHYDLDETDLEKIAGCFRKVWKNLDELR